MYNTEPTVFNFFSCNNISDEVYDLGACAITKTVTNIERINKDIFFIVILFFNRKVRKGVRKVHKDFLSVLCVFLCALCGYYFKHSCIFLHIAHCQLLGAKSQSLVYHTITRAIFAIFYFKTNVF